MRARSAELRRQARLHHLAHTVRPPRPAHHPPGAGARRTAAVRRRIGWTLIEVGLRLVHSGRGVAAP
nr:hypothetical protein [Streptomyces taklimakanensis]